MQSSKLTSGYFSKITDIINRGMDKEDMVHIYNGLLLSHKNNKIMLFITTWMDLEIVKLREVSQK